MSTNNPIRDTTPLHSEMSVPPPPSTAVHVAGMMIQPTSPPYMLEPLLETIRTSQTLSDEVLKELAHLFPSTTLVHALELLDKEKIIKYIAQPSQRELFAVEPSHRSSGGGGGGASLSHHHCHKPSTPLNNNNKMTTTTTTLVSSTTTFKSYKCISHSYCTCQSFAFGVIARKESKYCKHLLAVILADAIGCYKMIHVKDSEMGLLLLDEA